MVVFTFIFYCKYSLFCLLSPSINWFCFLYFILDGSSCSFMCTVWSWFSSQHEYCSESTATAADSKIRTSNRRKLSGKLISLWMQSSLWWEFYLILMQTFLDGGRQLSSLWAGLTIVCSQAVAVSCSLIALQRYTQQQIIDVDAFLYKRCPGLNCFVAKIGVHISWELSGMFANQCKRLQSWAWRWSDLFCWFILYCQGMNGSEL